MVPIVTIAVSTRHHPAIAPLDETDRRAEPRIAYQAAAQLLPYPPGKHPKPIDVTVTDYSASGIGVAHREGLMIGQAIRRRRGCQGQLGGVAGAESLRPRHPRGPTYFRAVRWRPLAPPE